MEIPEWQINTKKLLSNYEELNSKSKNSLVYKIHTDCPPEIFWEGSRIIFDQRASFILYFRDQITTVIS